MQLPSPGLGARLCRVGRPGLPGPAGPGGRGRLCGHGHPCGPWPAGGIGRRSRRGRPGGCAGRARGSWARRSWSAPDRTSRHGRGQPGSPRCPPGWRPGTPWTTRPRRSCSTSCGVRAPTDWPAWSPARGTPCSGCGAKRPMPCAPPWGWSRCGTRATMTPPSSATGSAMSCCRCAPTWRGATPCRCWPARPGSCATRSRSSTSWPGRRPPILRTPGPWPPCRSPWPGGRYANGCRPPGGPVRAARPTRPRWPRWNGSWRSPRGERWPRSSPGVAGCPGGAGGCRWKRAPRIVSPR